MNKIGDLVKRPIKEGSLLYFISILHAWIRCLECCLHISYRLTIKHSYGAYSAEQKKKMNEQEKEVKENLKEGLGLHVDKVKPGGYGNTNDGNMSRRFFENPSRTAELTGLNAIFLERVRVILVVLSSMFVADIEAFRAYCLETARQYVDLYSWYWMPCAVHKILLHAADEMKVAPVPIGLLSEEPLESCHKKLKHYRKHHTRLCNRTAGNTDLLRGLLVAKLCSVS
ncbi:hypothetical protein ONE63_003460 [Megalurothrips usitatus]|uniref:Uncharacterized protein n=1 Tax=Megalurothrips usitatus TaxID=439358 RepID=A0AAV7X9Q9_9NEOP|nr:hypothetical protein ONE63_003460 [Megalurothrips usitatus]